MKIERSQILSELINSNIYLLKKYLISLIFNLYKWLLVYINQPRQYIFWIFRDLVCLYAPEENKLYQFVS